MIFTQRALDMALLLLLLLLLLLRPLACRIQALVKLPRSVTTWRWPYRYYVMPASAAPISMLFAL